MTYDEYVDFLNEYMEKLLHDYEIHKLGHKQFLKLVGKLEEWEEMFVDRFEIEFEEEFE